MSILIKKNKRQQFLANDKRAEIWKKPGPIDCSLVHRIFYEVDDGNFIANLKSFKWWSDASHGLLQIDKEKDYLTDDQFSDRLVNKIGWQYIDQDAEDLVTELQDDLNDLQDIQDILSIFFSKHAGQIQMAYLCSEAHQFFSLERGEIPTLENHIAELIIKHGIDDGLKHIQQSNLARGLTDSFSNPHIFLEFFINFNYSLINVFAPVVHQKKQEANAQDKKSSDEQISGVEP